MRQSTSSLHSFTGMDHRPSMDDDDYDDPLLRSHTQAQAQAQAQRRRSSSIKQALTHMTRLSICLGIVGCLCITVFVTVIVLFYTFVEPCLNPFFGGYEYSDSFSATAQLVSISAVVSHTVLIKSLPPSLKNLVETQVALSAVSPTALGQVNVIRDVTSAAYSLRFERPPVFNTLAHCSYEDVTLGISPFDAFLNTTLQISSGSLEVRTMQQRFRSFEANLGSGQVVVGLLKCSDVLHLSSNDGSIKVSTVQSSRVSFVTKNGLLSLGTVTADEMELYTENGVISASNMILQSVSRKCYLSAHTEEGDIAITLLDIFSNGGACDIVLVAHRGNISLAVKRFSGTFTVKTGDGLVNVPGYPRCDGSTSCEGTVAPEQGFGQSINISTDIGTITLVFI